ncbi:hypothetical protein [Mesorhizobium captivum]|uniref:hypothetical protein n=1 Tax=Mesorhizobium captivum TaxID=3072319 RepID=UPI002A244CD7|nr:hypothetical protein [Mesorhizobium sp. VK3C]MDX8449670.1 hypothetical protein [Mesorhizobium sp. VK3C]
MLEENLSVMMVFDPRFPFEDVKAICARLDASQSLVPGFIPALAGIMSVEALLFAEQIDQTTTIILPDRNLVSRMARVARNGVLRPLDRPTQIAVDLMAVSQALNWDIEPSIAFHELAHQQGDEIANEELRWFRAADHGQANAWIDIAHGRANGLGSIKLGQSTDFALAAPLHRWRRNYAIALRVAALELSQRTPFERTTALINWMVSDFIVAGPAALFAAMFLSPRASRAGMIKHLKSPDRARAVAGVQNAAWDITHLSDFVLRATSPSAAGKRFILGTADQALAEIGRLLISNSEHLEAVEQKLAVDIEPWWASDAHAVAKLICGAVSVARARPRPEANGDHVGALISIGERLVVDCTP